MISFVKKIILILILGSLYYYLFIPSFFAIQCEKDFGEVIVMDGSEFCSKPDNK